MRRVIAPCFTVLTGAPLAGPGVRSGPRLRPGAATGAAHLRTRVWGMSLLLLLIAGPVVGQDGLGAPPDHASNRDYGPGWDCEIGYRERDGLCHPIDLPENAFPTGRRTGSGWQCGYGYREVDRTSCRAVPIPEHAFLGSSGFDWICERGYRATRDACVAIEVPAFGYLSDDGLGPGWRCARGYVAQGDGCDPIVIPEHAYASNREFGPAWLCDRGFIASDDACAPIILPARAFLDDASSLTGWRCERGFAAVDGACAAIDVPDHAHLDRSGNRWRCDPGFRLTGNGICALSH